MSHISPPDIRRNQYIIDKRYSDRSLADNVRVTKIHFSAQNSHVNLAPPRNSAMSDVAPSPLNLSRHRLDHGVPAMGEGGRLGGKRPARRSSRRLSPTKPPKVRKLSPVASRALAALENDSSGGEDGDGKRSEAAGSRQSPALHANDGGEDSPAAGSEAQSSPTTVSDDASTNGADAGMDTDEKRPTTDNCAPKSPRGEIASGEDTGAAASGGDMSDDSAKDGEEAVVPHPCNNDVLPFILATPFDGQSMLALHRLKEGIQFDAETAANLVSSHSNQVPILPQKQFNKFMREGQSAHNQNQAKGPMSSSDISAEVSSFLAAQGKSMMAKPQVSSHTPALSNENLAPFRYPPPPQQTQNELQMALMTQQLLLSHIAAQNPLHSYHSMLAYESLQQHNRQQQQLNELRHLQNLAALEQLSGGMSSAYNSDVAALGAARAMLLTTDGDAQSQRSSRISALASGYTGAAHNFPTAADQHQPFASQLNPATFQRAPAQDVSGAQVVHSPAKAVAPVPPVVAASHFCSKANVQATAKMPVAFGFHLDDDGSKLAALAAAANWKAQGQKAAKDVQSAKGRRSLCGTPKGAKTPKGSGTPKTPRTPAVLLSTKAATGLPEGWVVKTFKRSSGRTAGGTDKYFFSPQAELKFRSMKAAKAFVGILSEPGVDGKESEAAKLFKERGHKF